MIGLNHSTLHSQDYAQNATECLRRHVLVTTVGTSQEKRGYTGHEHLDDVGIIHMNGRIYSPSLGRMLSPDPVTQAPENAQNYN